MRNLMIGFFSVVILLLVTLMISSSTGKTMRQNELDSSFSSAMRSSMEALQEKEDETVTDQQFVADMIQSALVQTNGEADYKVTVYEINAEKGLLDAGVTATYKQVMHPGKVSVRRCIVLDDYTNELDEYFTVVFKDGDTIVKQLQIYGGDSLTAEMLPKGGKYKDAVWTYGGTTYSRATMSDVFVTSNMEFILN